MSSLIQAFLDLPLPVQVLLILLPVAFVSYGLYVTYGVQREAAAIAENVTGTGADVAAGTRHVVQTTGSTAANLVNFVASGFKNQKCPSGLRVNKNKGPYATAGKCKQKSKAKTCVRRGVSYRPCTK